MATDASHPPTLQLIDVAAGYRRDQDALVGMTLRCDGPQVVRLAGGNGEGKSTFTELVSGYLRPRIGQVLVNGHQASSPAARRSRRVCRTTPALFGDMTVRDHLSFAARCAQEPADEAVHRFSEYGGAPWLDHRASELSAGNARKLWLVMCTLGSFTVMVLDEPFSGLDDDGARVLLGEIEQWREFAVVVVVTHHLPAGLSPDRTISIRSISKQGREASHG